MQPNQGLNNTCILFDPKDEAQQIAIIRFYNDNGYFMEANWRVRTNTCIGVLEGLFNYWDIYKEMRIIDLPKEYYPIDTPIVESEEKDEKLKVGDLLYSLDLLEYKVTKIGKKYFECENTRGRFIIETLKSDSDFRAITLSKNKQEIIDCKEIESLESNIRTRLGNYGSTKLTLTQLRNIWNIMDNANNKSNY